MYVGATAEYGSLQGKVFNTMPARSGDFSCFPRVVNLLRSDVQVYILHVVEVQLLNIDKHNIEIKP